MARRWSNELDPGEMQELESWAAGAQGNRQLLELIDSEPSLQNELRLWQGVDPAAGYYRWLACLRRRRRTRIARLTAWATAVAVTVAAIILGVLSKEVKQDRGSRILVPSVTTLRPPMPGRNTAMLILDNGRQILLDSAGKGVLAVEGHMRLVKVDSASISYKAEEGHGAAVAGYNLLTTPRSGQYQLTLADGSRVWLNNVSSLRYPTAFSGKDRLVELTGEGYFEIAPDPAKPFLVSVRGQTIEVVGTRFNILAYAEEGATKTTLLSGAIRVKAGDVIVQLKPNDQVQVDSGRRVKVIHNVPSEDIASWKDGFFYFGGGTSFDEMMRQLGRWYNVEVTYEGKIPNVEYSGKIDRSLPLNDLLKCFDKNKIHFRLEGRKLIVLPS